MSLILADTSIWAQHLRSADGLLMQLAEAKRLLMHPMIIGELCVGNLPNRGAFIEALHQIDQVDRARDAEVLRLIETNRLYGSGIGWIDAHLLASVLIDDEVRLWTLDRRLNAAAERFGRAARLHH